MSGFFSKVLIGCAAVAVLGGVLAFFAGKANTRQVEWDLAPRDRLEAGELGAARQIIDQRLRTLQREFPLASWQIGATEEGLKLSLTGRRNFEEVVPKVCGRGLFELRLVEATLEDGQHVPEGCQALPHLEELINLEEIREPIVRETRLAVRTQPEMTCSQFKRVHYQTHGFRMQTVITLEFLEPDGKKFEEVTSTNVGQRLAVVMDDVVQVAPRIEGKVEGGKVQLLGIKMRAQARRLADFLRIGPLPCAFEATKVGEVGPPPASGG